MKKYINKEPDRIFSNEQILRIDVERCTIFLSGENVSLQRDEIYIGLGNICSNNGWNRQP